MPLINKKKDDALGNIRLPDAALSRAEQALTKVLKQSSGIRRNEAVQLGNPITGALYVPNSNNTRLFISSHGDESKSLGSIPSRGVPKDAIRLWNPIYVRKDNSGQYVFAELDASMGESYDEDAIQLPDQTPITQSQLDFATLQPFQGMVAVVKGAIYGDDAVKDLQTADFSASPLDTSLVAINIPSTNNRMIGVLVQLDPSSNTLSYKQSAEFPTLTLSESYRQGLLPLRDAGKYRVGYVALIAGKSQLDTGSVWTCPEFFPERGNVNGDSGGSTDNALTRWDGATGQVIQDSTVILNDTGDMSSLNSLSLSASSELTIASGAITITKSYHRVDTEADAASDDLDTISGGLTGRILYIRAENTARTVVIRHNGGGTGNIRTPGATSISLDETYKVAELLWDSDLSLWHVTGLSSGGIGGTTGATDNALLRADGTGGSTVQAGSGVIVTDAGEFSGAKISAGANNITRGSTGTTGIVSGVLTLGGTRNTRVSAESGTADDLVTLTVATINQGESVWLIADTGDTITVKHGAGNIFVASESDFVLSENYPIILTYRVGNYYEDTVSLGGTGVVDLTSDVTGVLPIANGGTNGSTATAAFDNLAPSTTKGDVIVHNGTDNVRVPIGTDGYRLTSRASDSEGLAWEADDAIAILRDEKTAGTDGGSSVATTWTQRDINTELYDPFSIVSISSNQFTPIAGDFEIDVSTQGFQLLSHRIRLYNVTGGASVEEGQNARNATAGAVSTTARLNCKFSANGTDAYRIDHYAGRTQATNGFGVNVNDGSAEVYTMIRLTRLSR